MKMQVSLDGGSTYVDAPNGVYVTYDDVLIDDENEDGLLEVKLTNEGIIMDVYSPSELVGTSSEDLASIIDNLVDDDDEDDDLADTN